MSEKTFWAEKIAVLVLLLTAGIFVISLGAGLLWQKAEEIPLLIQLGLYAVGTLMIVGGVYLLAFELILEGEPLKVTRDGLYIPTLRSRFRRVIRQRFLLRSEIAGLAIHDRGYALGITVVMKSGKRIRFLCPVDYEEDLERFRPQSQS